MKKIKAIIFDLDGTLINSESLHFSCWNELLSPFQVELDFDHYLNEYAGISLIKNAQQLLSHYDLKIPLAELTRRREQIYLDHISCHQIELMPYALETLTFFQDQNIPLGLVTSSSKSEVDIILEKSQLKHYFQSVITRDSVTNLKPHPEPYEASINSFGFSKNEYIVFEDTLTGVASAKSANLMCFAIQNNFTEALKLKGIADLVFNNLNDATNYLTKHNFLS